MSDPVYHPPHYNRGGIECIDVIEALGLGQDYCRANALKYLFRIGAKQNDIEDARKAGWYVNRLIVALEAERDQGTTAAIPPRNAD